MPVAQPTVMAEPLFITQKIWQAFRDAPDCAEVKLAEALRVIAKELVLFYEQDNSDLVYRIAKNIYTVADEIEAQ
jgi:hypothetical protein